MSKQDRQGVRTAPDLERKYDLGNLANQAKNSGYSSEKLSQITQELSQLNVEVARLNVEIEELSQASGNVEQFAEELAKLTEDVNGALEVTSALSTGKVDKTGWNPNTYLGTDAVGNVVEKETPIVSFLDVYPVGSIYMSVNNTDPSSFFGGTWAECHMLVGENIAFYMWERIS